MQPTGNAPLPRGGTTFKDGPRPVRPGFAIPDPPGGKITEPGNVDDSAARDAGEPGPLPHPARDLHG